MSTPTLFNIWTTIWIFSTPVGSVLGTPTGYKFIMLLTVSFSKLPFFPDMFAQLMATNFYPKWRLASADEQR